jgi:hypothetical protein
MMMMMTSLSPNPNPFFRTDGLSWLCGEHQQKKYIMNAHYTCLKSAPEFIILCMLLARDRKQSCYIKRYFSQNILYYGHDDELYDNDFA